MGRKIIFISQMKKQAHEVNNFQGYAAGKQIPVWNQVSLSPELVFFSLYLSASQHMQY